MEYRVHSVQRNPAADVPQGKWLSGMYLEMYPQNELELSRIEEVLAEFGQHPTQRVDGKQQTVHTIGPFTSVHWIYQGLDLLGRILKEVCQSTLTSQEVLANYEYSVKAVRFMFASRGA